MDTFAFRSEHARVCTVRCGREAPELEERGGGGSLSARPSPSRGKLAPLAGLSMRSGDAPAPIHLPVLSPTTRGSDAALAKLNLKWRTCLIIRELEAEINALARGKPHRDRLKELMSKKEMVGGVWSEGEGEKGTLRAVKGFSLFPIIPPPPSFSLSLTPPPTPLSPSPPLLPSLRSETCSTSCASPGSGSWRGTPMPLWTSPTRRRSTRRWRSCSGSWWVRL